jgi:transposase-like protein
MLPNPDASVTAIARLLGVSPGTLYNHIPDLREQGRTRSQLPTAVGKDDLPIASSARTTIS